MRNGTQSSTPLGAVKKVVKILSRIRFDGGGFRLFRGIGIGKLAFSGGFFGLRKSA
jgi:hypothetical protein